MQKDIGGYGFLALKRNIRTHRTFLLRALEPNSENLLIRYTLPLTYYPSSLASSIAFCCNYIIIIDADALKYAVYLPYNPLHYNYNYKKVLKRVMTLRPKPSQRLEIWYNYIDLMEGLSFKYCIAGNYSWGAKFRI